MQLKEKNDLMKTKQLIFTIVCSSLVWACGEPQKSKEEIAQDTHIADSLSKIAQSKRADSMKSKNPLLIMPPDSNYTGDYVDKYPTGVVKYRGYFRFGKRHGQWMSFYPTGLLWSEMNYDKGQRQGLNIAYFETGKKRYEGFYKNDMRDSVWCYYDSLDKVIEKVVFERNKIVKRLPLK